MNFIKGIKRIFAMFSINDFPTEQKKIVNKERFFKNNPQEKPSDDFIKNKMQAMKDSQGKSDYSGSSYNGPGNVDHGKTDSNMSQRNF